MKKIIEFKVWSKEEKRWLKSAILCPDGSVYEFEYPEDFTQLEYFSFENHKRYYPEDIEIIQL